MSWAIWITGRAGSGMSSLAHETAARLAERGSPVVVLELDRIRSVLTPAPTHGELEHEVVHRALVFMAAMLTEAGVPVVIDATAHRRAWRDLGRAAITRFVEVQLERPGATVPGVEGPYEPAQSPDVVIDGTSAAEVEAAAERIAALARTLPGPSRVRRDGGAVIWLTGPPGSGKTTLASRLAEALVAEDVAVKLLEWTALRAFVLGGGAGSALAEDIAHRALAYTGKLLADEGFAAVVDATAPRRAWRALARELAPAFAEVQLVCPLEICLGRERAVRWGAGPCPHRGGAGPDVVLEYEYSPSPELLLDTAARSEWAAAEDLVRLARRLLRRTGAAKESDHARA
jgi:adenylylsulfate kinase-like enzyme